jgi:SAM-dependent methyltransferase
VTFEKEYVLGTHDEEVGRLALQHRVWRPQVTAAWNRAGFAPGHTILDVGCGPGYASADLAGIVGRAGRVVAIDRSRRFLEVLESGRRKLGLHQISACELDVDTARLPGVTADGAWCRWIFAFVERPYDLLKEIGERLKPRGALVVHEYFDYSTWRTAPRCLEVEEFVGAVMESWRANGGEPDVGLRFGPWLDELGFEIREFRPLIFAVRPNDGLWQWLEAFLDVGRRRLVELGFLTPERGDAIREAFTAFAASPAARMITPGVLEIQAVRSER